MKRGSPLRRHVRLARVSAKVKRERPEYDAVIAAVKQRSGGRCEAAILVKRDMPNFYTRCSAIAADSHHTRKPRRLNHRPEFVIHLCRRCHDRCSASYRVGRLQIEPNGDGTFACQVVQKAGKWA